MNAGFSNFDFLKKQLLADSLQTGKRWDDRLLAIGLGVAKQFEQFCNREFGYQTGIKEIAGGDRSFWFARRPPVTQFTGVNLRFFKSDDWVSIQNQPLQADEEKGLIHFGYTLGRSPIQFQLIYNGGYWWEQLEPDDANYPSALPADITNNAAGIDASKFLLPDDLRLAWITQCRKVWEAIDKVGNKILDVGSNTRQPSEALAGLDLVPMVEQTLKQYTRYQIT